MGFFNIVKGLLKSSKKDILDLIEKRRIEFNPDVFVNPPDKVLTFINKK